MGIGKDKCIKLFSELEKGIGLIEKKRQGQGKPDLIYVKNGGFRRNRFNFFGKRCIRFKKKELSLYQITLKGKKDEKDLIINSYEDISENIGNKYWFEDKRKEYEKNNN